MANNETIILEVDVIINYRINAHHNFGFGQVVHPGLGQLPIL